MLHIYIRAYDLCLHKDGFSCFKFELWFLVPTLGKLFLFTICKFISSGLCKIFIKESITLGFDAQHITYG